MGRHQKHKRNRTSPHRGARGNGRKSWTLRDVARAKRRRLTEYLDESEQQAKRREDLDQWPT